MFIFLYIYQVVTLYIYIYIHIYLYIYIYIYIYIYVYRRPLGLAEINKHRNTLTGNCVSRKDLPRETTQKQKAENYPWIIMEHYFSLFARPVLAIADVDDECFCF